MRKGHKKINFFIVLALAISIPVAFTFFEYYALSIADFLSSQLKFEARDEISLPSVSDDKLRVLGLTSFNHFIFLNGNIFEQPAVVSLQEFLPEGDTLVLRC